MRHDLAPHYVYAQEGQPRQEMRGVEGHEDRGRDHRHGKDKRQEIRRVDGVAAQPHHGLLFILGAVSVHVSGVRENGRRGARLQAASGDIRRKGGNLARKSRRVRAMREGAPITAHGCLPLAQAPFK